MVISVFVLNSEIVAIPIPILHVDYIFLIQRSPLSLNVSWTHCKQSRCYRNECEKRWFVLSMKRQALLTCSWASSLLTLAVCRQCHVACLLCCPRFFALWFQRHFFLPSEPYLSPPSGQLRPWLFKEKALNPLAPAFFPEVLGAQIRQPDHNQSSSIQLHLKAEDVRKLRVHGSNGAQNPAMKMEKGW